MSTHTPPIPSKANGHAKPQGRSLLDQRKEEIRAKRQARGNLSDDTRLRLHVAPEVKDAGWEYRWVLDREMRIQQMQERDWIFAEVPGSEGDSGIGTRIERVTNDRTVVQAEKSFLMMKPKEFVEEDRRLRQARITERERQLESGNTGDPSRNVERGYTPSSGGIRIASNLQP